MMKNDIISYIIPIISVSISLISFIIQKISIAKKERLFSKKDYNIHISNFKIRNDSIDIKANEFVNNSSLEIDKFIFEITNEYIKILYRFINDLYCDADFSISVLLPNNEKNVLETYIKLDKKNSLPTLYKLYDYRIEDNPLYRNIINKKYNCIFITESDDNFEFYDTDQKKCKLSTFISYPISNDNDILGLINICSKDLFDDNKSNKLIIDMVSETASDIYRLYNKKLIE